MSVTKFIRDMLANQGVDFTNSRIALYVDRLDWTKIDRLTIDPDPTSAEQRDILEEFPYLQKGEVTADTR